MLARLESRWTMSTALGFTVFCRQMPPELPLTLKIPVLTSLCSSEAEQAVTALLRAFLGPVNLIMHLLRCAMSG